MLPKVTEHGKVTWRSTVIDATRGTLMRHERDDLAGILERALSKHTTWAEAMKVTRESFKPKRRR
jgi:hypothetical protein